MNAEQFSSALGKVNDRYIMEAVSYRKKKSGWVKWGAMAACFGLIVTAAMMTLPGLLNGPGGVAPPPGPDVPGPAAASPEPGIPGPVTSDNQPGAQPLQPPEKQNVIINWDNVAVNDSAGMAPDGARLYRDPALYNEEILDAEGVRAYYGWELAPAYIPDGLTGGGKAVSGRIVREKATGNIVEEQAGRSFWTDFREDGSPKSDDDVAIPTGFTIRVSKLGILRCALLPVDKSETTDFGGTPVTLSHASLPYGPFDPERMDPSGLYHLPAGYYDIYVASFTLDGVEYEIEAKRLELEEVVRIVASVVSWPSREDFTVGNP